ncbi:hypothetical protein AGDE_00419 [Angomonas deanei]|nr:hypothetical protein AGDE_07258 [Angomonas deanei]EPY43502.1 hypothetical protein AGDE_00419 [Angomonas deanei]|eukprot:EPY35748.1 hypothetical protein AGDE_07258 [Angomonas deanei]
MKVSLDMTFHKLPCEILSVDIIDVLHNHQVGSMKNIKSTRIDLKGKTIDPKTPVTPNEGCIIVGYIEVAKVPGNFHISSHTKPHEAARLFPEGINVEHTIRHLSFGSTNVKTLRKVAQLSPLDGRKGTSKRKNVMYQYFLEIIPTTYKGVLFSSDTYQFTSQMSKISLHPGHMPAVFFDYRLSPLSVQYSSGRVSFTHFLTYVCAIVGGVYTVCGLLSRFVHVSYAQIQKRMLGKGD